MIRSAIVFAYALASAATIHAQSWSAHWIWRYPSSSDQWVAFRKSFDVVQVPPSVPTRISADTKYWLYVNGVLVVFEGGLKGGPTRRDIYYDSLDLAPYIRPGRNTVAVLAWHYGKNGYSHFFRGVGGGGLLFQAEFGPAGRVISDPTWRLKVHPGYKVDVTGVQPNFRLPESNIYYDARDAAAIDGWTTPEFNDAGWQNADDLDIAGAQPFYQLYPRRIPFFRTTGLLQYASLSEVAGPGAARTVIGQLPSNIQITPYLMVDAPAGQVIRMETDRYMDGGEANVRSTYVTTGGVQAFESFGWMSGTAVRYTIPNTVKVIALAYRESGFDTQFAGTFVSGNAFFDRLWQQAARTLYVNMRDNYMDCPTRERAQWWGDVVNQIRAGAYVFDSSAHTLAAKAIGELVGWRKLTGELFAPVPAANWGSEIPQQMLASIWGSWRYYVLTGDSSWVAKAYPAFAFEVGLWRVGANHLVEHRAGDWDWADAGSNIDVLLLENAWYALAVEALAEMARVRGDAAEEARWRARWSTIADGIDKLWDPARQEYRGPQYPGETDDRANALAVVAGVVPANRYPGLVNVLRSHMNASPYLEFYVLEALYLMNAPEVAETRMISRYTPQVLGPDAGPTLWEYWVAADGTRNHGWNSGPLYALSAFVAGVRPIEPAFSTYEFRPRLGSFKTVRATVPTPRGTIAVSADATESRRLRLGLESPVGTKALVAVPVRGLSQIRITVNGTEVYANRGPVHGLPEWEYAGEDEDVIVFAAAPGSWAIERTGVIGGRLPAPRAPKVRPAPRSSAPGKPPSELLRLQ